MPPCDVSFRTLTKTLQLCGVVLGMCLLTVTILPAQTGFERAAEHAEQFVTLNEQTQLQLEKMGKLLDRTAEIRQSLLRSMQDARLIQVAGFQQEIVTSLQAMQMSAWSPSREREARGRREEPENSRGLVARRRAYIAAIGQYLIEASRLSQLYAAQQSTNKRHRMLFQEMDRLTGEVRETYQAHHKTVAEYRRLADVFGMRTRLEHKAALLVLDGLPEQNLGGRYARAITLRRLERWQAAEDELRDLVELDTTLRPLFKAAQAELQSARGDGQDALKSLAQITRMHPDLPEGHMLYGLVQVRHGTLEKALTAWRKALTLNQYEIEVRRNLALILADETRGRRRDQLEALEHAQLASELSLKEEWSVEAALALALDANGQKAEAFEHAQLSQTLTSGECLNYCEQLAAAIADNQPFHWDFLSH